MNYRFKCYRRINTNTGRQVLSLIDSTTGYDRFDDCFIVKKTLYIFFVQVLT